MFANGNYLKNTSCAKPLNLKNAWRPIQDGLLELRNYSACREIFLTKLLPQWRVNFKKEN